MNYGNVIYRENTGAYIIKDGTFCVPNPSDETVPEKIREEFKETWLEVDSYAKENPDRVTIEKPKPPLPELEAYKEQRKNELNTLHEAAEKEAHILSSLGFEIDANDRANRDVTGLLVTTDEGEQVAFMDYSNQSHMVTRADLEVMQKEIIENAQYLYSQKWTFRAQIEACETSEALSYLNFQFSYKSFYTQATE